jgi:hypothetical protein
MKHDVQVEWDWLDEAGQLQWEVLRKGRTLADSGGWVSARDGLMALLDLASELDDTGDDETAAAVMDQWAELAWDIKDRMDPELRDAIEEACDEWWQSDSEDS